MTADSAPLPYPFDRSWPLPQAVELACLLEASAPKLGNVHPAAHFDNMSLVHFLSSAISVGPIFIHAAQRSVGRMVLDSVLATRESVGCNTNLGTLLLVAPLARASAYTRVNHPTFQAAVTEVLHSLTAADCADVYSAIRAAQPGGLGKREQDDVAETAPHDLLSAMASAPRTDAVARQYINNFQDIFGSLVPWLIEELSRWQQPLEALCRVQLRWLAHEPDGLIVRKVGLQRATEVQHRAALVLHATTTNTQPLAQQPAAIEFDQFLRSDGHRLNPGTTADLLAATTLVVLLSVPAPALM
jgi:triphosphoribosyl-dephospho-CoA synthase